MLNKSAVGTMIFRSISALITCQQGGQTMEASVRMLRHEQSQPAWTGENEL
jgi:hypothetical protein